MKFTMQDLLTVTVITAVEVWFIMLLGRLYQVPVWVLISTGWVVVGGVVGVLLGQFREGVAGGLIGGGLALVSMITYAALTL
jgi:hypothetical protein